MFQAGFKLLQSGWEPSKCWKSEFRNIVDQEQSWSFYQKSSKSLKINMKGLRTSFAFAKQG